MLLLFCSLKIFGGGGNDVIVMNTWGDFCQKDLSWLFKAHGNKSASLVYKQEEGAFWYIGAGAALCHFLISGKKHCASCGILEVRELCDAAKYRAWMAFVSGLLASRDRLIFQPVEVRTFSEL